MICGDGDGVMILHTGGAKGADFFFAREMLSAGEVAILHSFDGHNPNVSGLSGYKILRHSKDELFNEAWPAYEKANQVLKRHVPRKEYVRNLILRDYFQIKDSEYVFAVAPMDSEKTVAGGTGYAVQMAIDKEIPVILFDDNRSFTWHYFSYKYNRFMQVNHSPERGYALSLTKENITGIGSRNISQTGASAIRLLFAKSDT